MRLPALLLLIAAAVSLPFTASAQSEKIGIFDLAAIRSVPLDPVVVDHQEADGIVTEMIRYTAMPGIRVFAYLSFPKGAKGLATNVDVLNKGTNDRRTDAKVGFVGFCACAPSANQNMNSHLTVGGAPDTEAGQFTADPKNSWIYQSVVVQLRGLDYLATRPEVDMKRVVVTGFSWSGFVTALLHAIDNRPCCYVTWNSTGYYADEQGMSGDKKSRISRQMYEMYAPSNYAKYGTQPIFVANSITDYFATLDGAIKMYKDLKCPKMFCWAPNRYHADTSRHEYLSSGPFMWQYQGGGAKLPTVNPGAFEARGGKLLYKYFVEGNMKPLRTEVLYSYGGAGHWIGRTWHRATAESRGADGYVAEIPVYDPKVPVFAVAQIEVQSTTDPTQNVSIGNCPEGFIPVDGGVPQANATYPTMLFDFEDRSDLYFGYGEPTFVTDHAEGNYAAQVTPFADGTIHLLNIEPFLWPKTATSLHFFLKGDGQPGPVNLYLVRDSDYYLDKNANNFSLVPIVKAGDTFADGWHEYSIPLSAIRDLDKVDSLWFECPGRKLLIDGIQIK